ncbi:methyltransferase family protein [Hasllibacter halocynthiae]|uniref:Methyltransferase family protein n=1 Tax=Hasllibacter halocynthiae TaxID=595589 RepID=A0A2T0X181_9RHOB|nr:methyltransferase domain-containing protein [Hasllibacter halocynthiae]PRY92614.1 methyltransferase family protein [Hasllibacter halocynthiae]
MHLDVTELRAFYYRTGLGRAAQRAVRDRVAARWGDVKGMTVAGYGFAVPLLRPFLRDARRVLALMPAPQGVMPWPTAGRNVSALVEEHWWPVETGHVDRLVMMHGLETSDAPGAVLEEAYRVLGPGGRLMVVVPNRAGIWSRHEGTPFGWGRPYTVGQLEAQLRRHGFLPEGHWATLFQPPSQRRFWRKVGPLMERIGGRVSNRVAGGVLLVEAAKQVPRPARGGSPESARAAAPAIGAAQPAARAF